MGQEITHNKIRTKIEDLRPLIDLDAIIVDKKDILLESVQVINFLIKLKKILNK